MSDDSNTERRPLAYTLSEAAELLRVSPSHIGTMVRSGVLPRVAGLGRTVRIPSRALYELVGEAVPPVAEPITRLPVDRVSDDRAHHHRTPTFVAAYSARCDRSIGRLRPERPREPKVVAPIDAGDRRLWLLADAAQYRLASWHIGEDATLCGRSPRGRWKRKVERWPRSKMCPTCLTTAAQLPHVDMRTLPIGQVAMLKETKRGQTVTAIRSGWHLGDGRSTSCGKRDGPWFLTEREPNQTKMCFVCDERRRWERERTPGTLEAESAGQPSWHVLLDAGGGLDDAEALIRLAPRLFAARTAERAITATDLEGYGAGLRDLFIRSAVLRPSSMHSWQHPPELVVTSNPSLRLPGSKWSRVDTVEGFIASMTPHVERATKAAALRERWERREPRRATERRQPGRYPFDGRSQRD